MVKLLMSVAVVYMLTVSVPVNILLMKKLGRDDRMLTVVPS